MKKIDPAVRQERLKARSAALRASVAEQGHEVLKKPLALADKARAGVQWVSRNPVLPLGVGLLLTVLLPKRAVVVWGSRLWGVWSTYKQVRNVVGAEPRRTRK